MPLPLRAGFKDGPTSPWGRYAPWTEVDISGANPNIQIPQDILWSKVTNEGQVAYSDPISSGNVQVILSSVQFNTTLSQIVNRDPGSTFVLTNNAIGSWCAVDFDPQQKGDWVCPSVFRTTHGYSTFTAFRLQNFSLQGGNGNNVYSATWQDLLTVTNTIAVPDPASNAWSDEFPILGLDPNVDQFRFLRLLQTGLNTQNSYELAAGRWLLGGAYSES